MKRLWFVLSAFVIISMFAVHASADSIIIRPTGDYNVHLDTHGAASNYQCVDDVTSDGDTTYIYNSQDGGIVNDLYNIDTLISFPDDPDNATIQNVTVHQISRKDSGSDIVESHGAIRANGSTNKKDGNIYSTSYGAFSSVWSTNPGTGNAWEWCDFTNSNFMFGIEIYNYAGSYGRCTQCWVEVNYNTSGEEPPNGSSGFSSGFSWTTASIVIVTAGVIGGLAAFSYKRSR